MKKMNISQQIALLSNHRSIENIQKITKLQYVFTFILKNTSSIYSNNIWTVMMILPKDFPQNPPKLKFQTPIFHLNVNKEGFVSMSILKDDWNPKASLQSVINELQNILQYPDANHAANKQILEIYKKNPSFYNEKCMHHLYILKDRSIVDSEGKIQILEDINELQQMGLTKFQGIQQGNMTLTSILKNPKPYLPDNKIINSPQIKKKNFNLTLKRKQSFSNSTKISNKKQRQQNDQQLKVIKKIDQNFMKQKNNTGNKKTNPFTKLQLQTKRKDFRQQNIFNLSISRDFKNQTKQTNQIIQEQFSPKYSMKKVKSACKLTVSTGQNLNTKRTVKNIKSNQFQRIKIEENKEKYQKLQINKSTEQSDIQQKPQIEELNIILKRVSTQFWATVKSIEQIQQSLKDPNRLKNGSLQNILQRKLNNQIQSLQKLQILQNQIKERMFLKFQNKIQQF